MTLLEGLITELPKEVAELPNMKAALEAGVSPKDLLYAWAALATIETYARCRVRGLSHEVALGLGPFRPGAVLYMLGEGFTPELTVEALTVTGEELIAAILSARYIGISVEELSTRIDLTELFSARIAGEDLSRFKGEA